MRTFSRDDFLFEFRSQKARVGPPAYVPFSGLFSLTGYGSVFGVTKEQAGENVRRGSTNGAYWDVYCDTLLVDFDDRPADADAFERALIGMGAAYIRANSGGRSVHFHAAIEPMFGRDVAYSLRCWVGRVAPGADLSVYQRNGMFRLFGTRHEKTGRFKEHVHTHPGRAIAIPYVEEEDRWAGGGGAVSGLEGALAQALSLLQCSPGVGGRHQVLWSLARNLADELVGVAPDPAAAVEALIYAVNASFPQPKESSDLQRIMRDLKI